LLRRNAPLTQSSLGCGQQAPALKILPFQRWQHAQSSTIMALLATMFAVEAPARRLQLALPCVPICNDEAPNLPQPYVPG
jgi:hypothetical protein